MAFHVRLATEDDFPRLKVVAHWLDTEHRERGEPSVQAKVVAGMAHMLQTGQAIVVAEAGADLIGFCAWAHLPENLEGEMSGLGTYVRPGWRERGVSEAMRDVATKEALARGMTSVAGMVVAGNHAGLESVLRLGFRVVGWVVRKDLGDEVREGQQGRDGQGRRERREGQRPEVLLTKAAGTVALDWPAERSAKPLGDAI